MTALTKADIAEKLFNQIGLNKREAKDLIDDFFEEMRIALENGQHIKLSSFGNFILRDKVSRPGRNPKTGKEATVSARRVVTFKPSQQLKSLIEEKLKQKAKNKTGKK